VVSIGNITTGGTGKTPLVAWLSNYFASKNHAVAILTRGYKLRGSDFSDEPAMLAKSSPGAMVIVNPDRVAGAKKAIEQGVYTMVMDDGFQHRRLFRDIDIVAIDATEPFGYGRLLPGGLLREPIKSLKRADCVVITRYNQTQPGNVSEICKTIKQINPEVRIAKAIHKPVKAKMRKEEVLDFDDLRGQKVFAFCGIGNPNAFFETLCELRLNIAGTKVYNDHHRYRQSDIEDIYEQAKYCRAEVVLTTEKDWTKTALLCGEKLDMPFAYLEVELDFVEGAEEIAGLIEEAIGKASGKDQESE